MSRSTLLRLRRLVFELLAALIAGIWIASLSYVLQRIGTVYMGDFLTYAAGASHVLTSAPLYPAFELEGPFYVVAAAWGVGYVYPPTAAVLSAPLGLMSVADGFVIFTVLSGIALVAVVFAIGRSAGLSKSVALGLTLVVVSSGPAIDSLATGNANTLAAAGLGVSWLAPRTSGYVAALGAMVKLYPGLGFVWTIRKGAPVLGPILVGVVVVLLTCLWLGTGAWTAFVQTLANGRPVAYVFIQPPRNVLEPVIGATAAAVSAYSITAMLTLVAWRHRSDDVAFFALSLAMIMPAPDWHFHYYLIPVIGAVPWVAHRIASRRLLGSRSAIDPKDQGQTIPAL